VFVVVLIVFSAAALWQAYQIAGFSKLSSPGVFPMLAAALMLLSGLFILRSELQSVPVKSETGDGQPIVPVRVAVVTLLLVLYVIAMPTLGFLLDSGLFLFACLAYLWKKPLWMALLVSLVSLVAIHLVFREVFQVILPQGTLPALF